MTLPTMPPALRPSVPPSWRLATIVLWAVSRAALFLNVVWGHHFCDRVFWLYAHRSIALGLLPYRDYGVEYPPLATALFMIPGAARDYASYAAGFALVMLLVDLGTVALVRATTQRLCPGADGWRAAFYYTALGLATFALATKFDLLPGALTLAAILLLVRGREGAAWVVLAAAVLFKGYAVVLAPLFLLYRYRLRGASGWWRGPLWGVAASFVVLVPALLIAGLRAVEEPLGFHARRGLEIESVYASVVLIAHHVAHLAVSVTPGTETLSRDVFSALNGSLLALPPWLLGGLLAATYVVAWVRLRRDPTPDALLLLSMAAVAAFMLAFKALPTHYLLWLCPMAAATLAGATSRATRAGAALGLALALGALVPLIWPQLRALDSPAIAVIVARNVAIVATFVLLLITAWSTGRRTARGAGSRHEAEAHGRRARPALAGR